MLNQPTESEHLANAMQRKMQGAFQGVKVDNNFTRGWK